MVGTLMLRLYGSDDLFPDNPRDARRPYQSINYVTCHDGFTLYDSVAHNEKHNWANGHGNRDGTADNSSWNCGWEGDEGVPAEVMALRKRQAKNLSASCCSPTVSRCWSRATSSCTPSGATTTPITRTTRRRGWTGRARRCMPTIFGS